jgi:hypothetical protein
VRAQTIGDALDFGLAVGGPHEVVNAAGGSSITATFPMLTVPLRF